MSSTSTTVVVGVCGGIAAYKSCELIRGLKAEHFDVHVIPTLNALRFVGEATLSALSGNKVLTDVWQEAQDVHHISLAQTASAIVVYPATADFLARLVEGRANDLLTATLLSTKAPKILFPAMHTEMWLNEATQKNVKTLRDRGYLVVVPESGKLTSGDSGLGRLSDAECASALIAHASNNLEPFDLQGLKIVITAGGTRENIDPVRYISNSSSGKQGFALATAAVARGAEVTLIAANTALPIPSGVSLVRVTSAKEMLDALMRHAKIADVIIMAAAVSDFVPKVASDEKIKKIEQQNLIIDLELAPDILSALIESKSESQTIVGFAAETGKDAHVRGVAKLLSKGCNIAVANDVTDGAIFGEDETEVLIQTDNGELESSTRHTKLRISHQILNSVRTYRMSGK
jgi:phosphopantothenoylcysteine decarboxylase/phosphopantothenate--cysteine ligase